MSVNRRIKIWADTRGISDQQPSECDWDKTHDYLNILHDKLKINGVSGYVLNKVEELAEYAEAKLNNDENGIVDAICDSRIFDATELVKMNYCVDDCDDEVLKVIESRTGEWSDSLGKFMKDLSPEAVSKWYEPNYVKNCKYKCVVIV